MLMRTDWYSTKGRCPARNCVAKPLCRDENTFAAAAWGGNLEVHENGCPWDRTLEQEDLECLNYAKIIVVQSDINICDIFINMSEPSKLPNDPSSEVDLDVPSGVLDINKDVKEDKDKENAEDVMEKEDKNIKEKKKGCCAII
jgi:hypothetical protein